eukprot:5449106-Prymnesium_polylepis.1
MGVWGLARAPPRGGPVPTRTSQLSGSCGLRCGSHAIGCVPCRGEAALLPSFDSAARVCECRGHTRPPSASADAAAPCRAAFCER